MKKIYIGCSLSYASKEFISEVESFKNELRSDYEILDFLGKIKGTPREVFEHDTKCVLASDLFVAICDLPSTGLGYEIRLALENNKKVLAIAKEYSKISRLILGVNKPGFNLIRYKKLHDCIDTIKTSF